MKTTLTILATFLLGGTLTGNVYAQSTISEANFAELNQSVIQPFWQNQVQKGSLQSSDGLTLAYSYVIPAQAKATILLIQGRTESMMKYHELMWELSQQGYAVFTMDHRGQGLSDRMLENREKGHVEKFQQYVDDQQVFINTVVLSKQTSGQLLLLTHSMGGAVGSLLLAQQPTLFKAAVLSSPMHMPNTEVLFSEADGCYLASALGWMCSDCFAGFVDVPYNETPFAKNVLTQSEIRYKAFRDQYRALPKLQLGGPTWQWVNESCDIADELPELAKNIQTPFLILQGTADTVVSNSAQDEFCESAGQSCTGVIKVKDAMHELFIEKDVYRQQALTALLGFFDKALK